MPDEIADIGMHPKNPNCPMPIRIQKLDSNQVPADSEKLDLMALE